MPLKLLTPIEARVLGTLMEKARTVPDSYPLSLNSLVLGCNQKTSREPLMQITEAQAQQALEAMMASALVFENRGGRTARYEHNFQRAAGVGEAAAVLLGLLMLRGPQTPGELRLSAERWYRFADITAVENALESLLADGQDRGCPMVVKLPRMPGSREARWAHLLCGPVEVPLPAVNPHHPGAAAGAVGTDLELQHLRDRVAALETGLATLCEQLGVELPGLLAPSPPAENP